jgi:hypothetical protein
MSQPEKRPKIKLDARVSPELKEKVREYQQTKGMKEISDAIIALIERGLLPDVEALNLQTCEYKSEIPSKFGEFINCKRPLPSYRLGIRRIPERASTVCKQGQECLACQLYEIIRVPLTNKEQLEDEILDKKEDLNDLLEEIKKAEICLSELQGKIMDSNPSVHRDLTQPIHETSTLVKAEPNPQLIKRTVEEKKTTEEFSPPQPKVISNPILCPKLSDVVSIDDTCKKCESCMTCPEYGQYIMLKRAIKTQ